MNKSVSRKKLGRPGDDTMGIVCEDFEGHDVSAVGNKANKIPKCFLRFARKRHVIYVIEDWLVPVEAKEGAYVYHCAQEDSKRDTPVKGPCGRAVKYGTYVL